MLLLDKCAHTYTSQAIQWTIASVALVLTCGRFYIRWKYSQINWDDICNGVALLCLVANYAVFDVGWVTDRDQTLHWRSLTATSMLFWTTLWLVKASFLALCWLIFEVSNGFRKAWWIVVAYTFLTYWPLFLWIIWECGEASDYDNAIVCSSIVASPYFR